MFEIFFGFLERVSTRRYKYWYAGEVNDLRVEIFVDYDAPFLINYQEIVQIINENETKKQIHRALFKYFKSLNCEVRALKHEIKVNKRRHKKRYYNQNYAIRSKKTCIIMISYYPYAFKSWEYKMIRISKNIAEKFDRIKGKLSISTKKMYKIIKTKINNFFELDDL